MTVHLFTKQIEYLLFTGAIEGKQILNLSQLLAQYRKGAITDEEMQNAIDCYDPDQREILLDEQFPPPLD